MGLELSGAHDECPCNTCERLRAKMREYDVAVFVKAAKSRGWEFRAYIRDYDRTTPGCNMVRVQAANGKAAKAIAIAMVKARMDLQSRIPPSGVAVCSQAAKAAGGKG